MSPEWAEQWICHKVAEANMRSITQLLVCQVFLWHMQEAINATPEQERPRVLISTSAIGERPAKLRFLPLSQR